MRWVQELYFTRHKFLLVTVKEWLKSVLNYQSYPKNKTGYPFFGTPCIVAKDLQNRKKFIAYDATDTNK